MDHLQRHCHCGLTSPDFLCGNADGGGEADDYDDESNVMDEGEI